MREDVEHRGRERCRRERPTPLALAGGLAIVACIFHLTGGARLLAAAGMVLGVIALALG